MLWSDFLYLLDSLFEFLKSVQIKFFTHPIDCNKIFGQIIFEMTKWTV